MYEVALEDGQTFWMDVDLSQANSPIRASFEKTPYKEGHWQNTPFQCADARHNRFHAARLVAEYFKADEDDCTEVVQVHGVYDTEPAQ